MEIQSNPQKAGVIVSAMRTAPKPDTVFKAIEQLFGVSKEKLVAETRTRDLTVLRYFVMYVACKLEGRSTIQAGKLMGRDHSTVINGLARLDYLLKTSDDVRVMLEDVLELSNSLEFGIPANDKTEVRALPVLQVTEVEPHMVRHIAEYRDVGMTNAAIAATLGLSIGQVKATILKLVRYGSSDAVVQFNENRRAASERKAKAKEDKTYERQVDKDVRPIHVVGEVGSIEWWRSNDAAFKAAMRAWIRDLKTEQRLNHGGTG